jgi:hypothetical protein
VVTRLRTSIYPAFISHARLLRAEKKSIFAYLLSPYRILLIGIFALLFLPHVFVVVKDINFVIAYEVDPGSIIRAIMSLYENSYNMNMSYHSRYYGWTYYAISYFLLMPIYFAKSLGLLRDDTFFFVGLRFIFFAIGLLSTLAYFEVAKRILKNVFLAFAAALLFIASPAVFRYFYWIHPESTGILFLFLGVLSLLRFNDSRGEDTRWYTFGLISLVLSALSKQVFLITALPVLFLFYYSYCYYHGISIWKFAVSRQFFKVLLFTIFLALLIFFIINPFAFLQFDTFVTNQRFMFSTQTNGAVSRLEAIQKWLEIIRSAPIMYLSILSAPVTLLGAMILGRNQKIGRAFFMVSLFSSILYVILILISARYLIQMGYFAPIYPFFILNFLIIPLYVIRKWNIPWLKFATGSSLIFLLGFVLVSDFSTTIPNGYARLRYKRSPVYQAYAYIRDNIPRGSKIAHDHLVAVPSLNGLEGCQYWYGSCGTDYIEQFRPDYVIFSETWKFNGETLPETQRLQKYVRDHRFVFVENIGNTQLSVWRRREP